ncbi:MAG: transcriptional repressor [Actinomycetota bacterium]|nr:transcriptional repressor [Actinomycetota bacterium]
MDSLRLTPHRQAVLAVLTAAPDHPTAAEVLDRVRRVAPGIGAATVYRALGRLVENGQALELKLDGAAAARYDANTHRHDHLVCDSCGAAVDIDAAMPSRLARAVAGSTGYAVASYDLTFHGRCPACQTTTLTPH